MTIRPTKSEPLPHSWPVADWPPHVFPNRANDARYMVRANHDALVECGALTRIGRVLVVLGAGYAVFLAKQASKVAGYVPSNPPPHGTHRKNKRDRDAALDIA